jgi:quinoprotein glucose dehydrogenase
MIAALLLLAAAQPAPSDPEFAVRKLRPAEGLQVGLWAAEPKLQNPISLSIDEKGRVFVAETGRHRSSVLDIRTWMGRFYDDASCRSVADREAMIRKWYGTDAGRFEVETETVRLLEDVDGDGRADRSTVFADGFRSMADGLASGVLARKGEVWLACVPNLWKLSDRDGDGAAEQRKAVFSGFGVRFQLIGHDLHGLTLGPDGKLYFTMGDRGFSVVTNEGERLEYPDMGAVLRCDLDGANLEVYAFGLRNPQELAFDAFGNLVTGENNMDVGDPARMLHVVEGADFGWRAGFQFSSEAWGAPAPGDPPPGFARKGAWMTEETWKSPSHVLPAAGFVGAGPSGLAYDPGTGLSARWAGRFFLCDYPGGIRAIAMKPRGASLEVAEHEKFLWDAMPTDCEFGPDGALYVTDWVEGWERTGKGRIFRVADPAADRAPIEEARKLIAEGMAPRAPQELASLMGHRDQRVRLAAQQELVGRQGSTQQLSASARQTANRMERLHAIWGLGQLYTRRPLLPLLKDTDEEVRAQTARVLGDRRVADAYEDLVKALKDPAPKVRYYAAIALGKLGRRESARPIADMVRENADADPYLRHAGVYALALLGSGSLLQDLAKDSSVAVRRAVLLAGRRLGRWEVSNFLDDADPGLVVDAARAIHDLPIGPAMPRLAALLGKASCPEGALLRAIDANFRTGQAPPLAAFAARKEAPPALRVEALRALAAWAKPNPRERVTGLWRPLPERDAAPARDALRPVLEALLGDAAPEIRVEAAQAAAALAIAEAAPALRALAVDSSAAPAARARALRAYAGLADAVSLLAAAAADPEIAVRAEAVRLLAGSKDAVGLLLKLAEGDPALPIRQAAVRALGPAASPLLDRAPAELLLDVLEAAGAKEIPPSALLQGGDVEAGRKVFFERGEAQCGRCHKAKRGGGEVGPDLSAVAGRLTPEQLLAAVLDPNREIAKGYEQVVVLTASDAVEVGRVEREDGKELVLVQADGTRRVIPIDRVKARKAGLSAMPADAAKALSKRDLRDLVAFLATLR